MSQEDRLEPNGPINFVSHPLCSFSLWKPWQTKINFMFVISQNDIACSKEGREQGGLRSYGEGGQGVG
jgi:hypothetical protein